MNPSDEAPAPPDDPNAVPTSQDGPTDRVRLKRPKSLRHLRERVEAAHDEIVRLREANEALAAHIAALEEEPAGNEGTVLRLQDDPQLLRQQVEDFIRAIDTYLTDESSADHA